MKILMLKSKIHQATITDANVAYEGSIGIDTELMAPVGLYPFEKVLVADLNNGERFETYTIAEPAGSRRIVVNGAAAHRVKIGDRIIIMAFCWVKDSKVESGEFQPLLIRLDGQNNPIALPVT
ncbi:MAG: Aspartate 1-decarboxylase [Phycisphaerae bacterium]|nr:Aspartate 1-decarboxylase [Phycisphaerae bacterium]